MKNLNHSNCIVVFNKEKDAVLFYERQKEPYKGRLNFLGGKLEPGEDSASAAYSGESSERYKGPAHADDCTESSVTNLIRRRIHDGS